MDHIHTSESAPAAHADETRTFVPVIDLSSRDTAAGRAALASMIRAACETSGFFIVTGHGVSPELVERMYTTTNTFFCLQDAEKELSACQAGVSGLRRLDTYEAFAVHATGDLSAAEREALGNYPSSWKVANIWPTCPRDFRSTWLEYMSAVTEVSADIMRLFAVALDLPEAFFDDKFNNHVSMLLANYYPPRRADRADEGLRRERHTDWGTLTVLYQEHDDGGLQVQDPHGDWLDVPAVPGSFVVNIGDLMAFWTNGRWASTVHRVTKPSGDSRSRISIPFFHFPNHDTSIEPLTEFGEPAGDASVTVGQWFTAKLQAAYAPTLGTD